MYSGPKNQGVARQLGISNNNSTFVNPYDPSRVIVWLFDFVHLFKNLRNHFLDDVVKLPCGLIVTSDDFFDLLEVVQSEVTSGFNLSEKDLQVSGNDRQDVGSAIRLLSDRTAALLIEHFPNDSSKQALARVIDMVAKCFKIMTSRVLTDRSDIWKCALRIHFEKQKSELLKFKDFMENTTFADNDFQQGCIVTINGILDLHHLLKTKFDLPYLKCSHVDQDYVESAFGMIRRDSRGGRVKPSALGLGYRLARYIVDKVQEDKSGISIFDLKEALKIAPIGEAMLDIPLPKIPMKYLQCKKNGLHWIAGVIARRYRKIQPELGAYTKDVTRQHEQNSFTSLLNRGGLTIPTKSWFKDLKAMDVLFNNFHPKNCLRPGRGVTSHFFALLSSKFPNYDPKILTLVTKFLTLFRTRTWNALAKHKKAGQKVENMKIPRIKKLLPLTKMQKRKLVGHKRGTNKNVAPITLRGKVKTAQYSTK